MPPAGGNEPIRQSKATELEAQAVLRLIGVAVLLRLLQSRRFWERLAVGGIVLGALGRMGQENRASTITRLVAWNKRQAGRLERQAERQAEHLERQASAGGRWPHNRCWINSGQSASAAPLVMGPVRGACLHGAACPVVAA